MEGEKKKSGLPEDARGTTPNKQLLEEIRKLLRELDQELRGILGITHPQG